MLNVMSAFAVYFVVWWITLFMVLPVGLRTQGEEKDVVLGTDASAPARFRGLRVVVWTTLLSAAFFAAWYGSFAYFGLSMDDLPRIVPNFG